MHGLTLQVYVEDSQEVASEGEAQLGVVKALALARKSHEAIIRNERLTCVVLDHIIFLMPASEEGALALMLPVVLTCWPEVCTETNFA